MWNGSCGSVAITLKLKLENFINLFINTNHYFFGLTVPPKDITLEETRPIFYNLQKFFIWSAFPLTIELLLYNILFFRWYKIPKLLSQFEFDWSLSKCCYLINDHFNSVFLLSWACWSWTNATTSPSIGHFSFSEMSYMRLPVPDCLISSCFTKWMLIYTHIASAHIEHNAQNWMSICINQAVNLVSYYASLVGHNKNREEHWF